MCPKILAPTTWWNAQLRIENKTTQIRPSYPKCCEIAWNLHAFVVLRLVVVNVYSEQFEIQTNPVHNYSEEVILIEERKWNDNLAYKHFRGNTFETKVSNWS